MAGSHAATQRHNSSRIPLVHSGLPQVPKRRARALVTYGKPSKPLSLTGAHFVRKDEFDLSSDDGKKNTKVSFKSSCDPVERYRSSDGSPLSVAEPSRIQSYGVDQGMKQQASSRIQTERCQVNKNMSTTRPQSAKKKAGHQDISTLIPRKGAGHKLLSHATPLCQAKRTVSKERSDASLSNSHAIELTRKEKPVIHASEPRLSLDELVLVNYPMTAHCNQEPEDTLDAFERQDPILDDVSTSNLRQAPFVTPCKSRNPLRSSRIGKRIKIQLHRNRTVKRWRRDCVTSLGDRRAQRGADGFEPPEMKVNRQHMSIRHSRKSFISSRPDFAALQLRSGPLPHVIFSSADGMLTLSPESDGSVDSCPKWVHSNGDMSQHNPHASGIRPKVSFRGKNAWIMAQLSSISAPIREEDDEDSGSQAQTDDSEEDGSGDDPRSDEVETEDGEDEDDDGQSTLWTQFDQQE